MKLAKYLSDGMGKSYRAYAAEDKGLFPLSVITKKRNIKVRLRALGILPDEWHHTGAYARRTNYYRASTVLAIAKMSRGEYEAALSRRKARMDSRYKAASISEYSRLRVALAAAKEQHATYSAGIGGTEGWLRDAYEVSIGIAQRKISALRERIAELSA